MGYKLVNSIKWGLGNFAYGDVLRTCHNIQNIKNRRFAEHVEAFAKEDIISDPVLESGSAMQYLMDMFHEADLLGAASSSKMSLSAAADAGEGERKSKSRLWVKFVRLVYGQKGPFSKLGTNEVPDQYLTHSIRFLGGV